MADLTAKAQQALGKIPFDGWINLLQIGASRSAMKRLVSAGTLPIDGVSAHTSRT